MNRRARLSLKLAGGVVAAVGFYLLLLAFPEPLFTHSFTTGSITVYANTELSPALAAILEAATARASQSSGRREGWSTSTWRLALTT